MADDLTPDTGAETEELVLDQEQAVPEPTPPPEPVAPEPEPQAPEWLRDIGAPPEPEQPAQPAAPPQQPQQPQQPYYQYPQQPTADQNLERFVQDPNGYIRQQAEQIAQQMFERQLGPVAYNLQQMEQKVNAHSQVSASNLVNQTLGVVDQAYRSVIGKDRAYRENEQVKNYVDTQMKDMLANAAQRAYAGDPSALQMFHKPSFARVFMAAAREEMGYQPNAVGPATPAGAMVEGATPPQQQEVIQLPPDQEEIAKRMSPAKAQELREAWKKSQELGDFEAWE